MDKYQKLRRYNISMGFFHFVQAILMLVLSTDFKLPITTSYLQFNPQTQALAPVLETLTEIKIAPLVALFLFLSATVHFLISLPKIYEWYIANLKKGINYARWYEYALSSSLMIVVISMLVGVYDLSTLILVFSLNAAMIFFGLMMELHNQTTKITNWTSFIYGSIAGLIPWVVIGLFLFNSGEGEFKAPSFVYWIFLSMFIFFNTFAINMILQYKKVGRWQDYTWGEIVYVFLSLVAKSLLAWQVFAGTLRPV